MEPPPCPDKSLLGRALNHFEAAYTCNSCVQKIGFNFNSSLDESSLWLVSPCFHRICSQCWNTLESSNSDVISEHTKELSTCPACGVSVQKVAPVVQSSHLMQLLHHHYHQSMTCEHNNRDVNIKLERIRPRNQTGGRMILGQSSSCRRKRCRNGETLVMPKRPKLDGIFDFHSPSSMDHCKDLKEHVNMNDHVHSPTESVVMTMDSHIALVHSSYPPQDDTGIHTETTFQHHARPCMDEIDSDMTDPMTYNPVQPPMTGTHYVQMFTGQSDQAPHGNYDTNSQVIHNKPNYNWNSEQSYISSPSSPTSLDEKPVESSYVVEATYVPPKIMLDKACPTSSYSSSYSSSMNRNKIGSNHSKSSENHQTGYCLSVDRHKHQDTDAVGKHHPTFVTPGSALQYTRSKRSTVPIVVDLLHWKEIRALQGLVDANIGHVLSSPPKNPRQTYILVTSCQPIHLNNQKTLYICPQTDAYEQALNDGMQVVSGQWLIESFSSMKLVPILEYLVHCSFA